MEIFNIDLFGEILLYLSDINTIISITIAIPGLDKYIEKEYIYETLKNNLIRDNKKHIIDDKCLISYNEYLVLLQNDDYDYDFKFDKYNLKIFYEQNYMTKNSYKYCKLYGCFLISYAINDINTIDSLINKYDEEDSIRACVFALMDILSHKSLDIFYTSYSFFLNKLKNITVPLLNRMLNKTSKCITFSKDNFLKDNFSEIIHNIISLNENVYFEEDFSTKIALYFCEYKDSFNLIYSLLVSKVKSRKLLDESISKEIIKILPSKKCNIFKDNIAYSLKSLQYIPDYLYLKLWEISLTNLEKCLRCPFCKPDSDKDFDIMIYYFSKLDYDEYYKPYWSLFSFSHGSYLIGTFTNIINHKNYSECIITWTKEKLEFINKEYNN